MFAKHTSAGLLRPLCGASETVDGSLAVAVGRRRVPRYAWTLGLAALLLTAALPAVAKAATRCVDQTDGSCVTSGSFAVCPTNYCTIEDAVKDSSAGDTIKVSLETDGGAAITVTAIVK